MKINIVIPCYNEQEVLPKTLEVLGNLVVRIKQETGAETALLLVDDGSRDTTWQLIKEAAEKHSYVKGIKLSHNRGHQNALWAGMEASVDHCDAMVSIDADLQDDENVIVDMVKQVQEGKDIIYGVRKERKTDTFFKRFTAQAFYKLMQSVDKEVVYNHADFRMMTNRTLKALMQYPERNLFLRAIVRQLGFREGFVYYDRKAREAGESKYPLTKMLSFSIDGITSFSVAPLRFITFMGLAMTLVAIIMIIFALVEHFQGKTIQGWTSMLVSLWFIGGISSFISMGARYQYKWKNEATTQRARLYLRMNRSAWSSKTQVDATWLSGSRGYMASEAFAYRYRWLRLQASMGYFHTSDYDSRVYALEPGMLYTMSFGSYFGEGIRCALLAKVDVGSHWLLACKWAMTQYFDRNHISSGLQQINGSCQSDLELQLKWKW